MFSNTCRYMARQVSIQAEKNDMIAKEQYGSRKFKDALAQAIVMRLIMDLSKQLRQPMSATANDLVACYDRTAHLIPALMEQCCGLPLGAVELRFETTQ